MDSLWVCCANNLAGDSCSPLGQAWQVSICLGTSLVKKSRVEQDVGRCILHVWAACPHSSPFYLSHGSLQGMGVSCLLFALGMQEERKKGSSHAPMLTESDPCSVYYSAQEAESFSMKAHLSDSLESVQSGKD